MSDVKSESHRMHQQRSEQVVKYLRIREQLTPPVPAPQPLGPPAPVSAAPVVGSSLTVQSALNTVGPPGAR